MSTGWIKLHRKFLQWEWYDDINTKTLFIHCLLKANHKDKKWRGNHIKRGSFITSLNNLSSETGLSLQQVRTAIEKLESTGEINKETTNLNTCISITYYDEYQSNNKEATNEQQSNNNQITTTKNVKNVKNVKKYTIPREEDVEKYFRKRGDMIVDDISLEVEKFINHYSERDWKTSSGDRIKYWRNQASTWNANYQQYNKDRLNKTSKNGESKNLEIFGL